MKQVDARGMQCPLPIIETKKVLRTSETGEPFMVLIDNETSLSNVCKFLEDNKCTYSVKDEKGYWSLTVSGSGEPLNQEDEEVYCELPGAVVPDGDYVIVLASDTMGQGDDTLGKRLMTSFVNIVTELDELPSAIVCYNSGVKLALSESPVVATLIELERRGVEVILCGTCIDFFGIKGKTSAGKTGDMYLIATILASSSSFIKP